MTTKRTISLTLLTILGSVTMAQAAPYVSRLDLFFGPRLFQQTGSDTSNKTEISMAGPKALAINDITNKDEIKKKKMTIVGKEGNHLLGFHVYYDYFHNVFLPEDKSVYYTGHSQGGIVGGDVLLPGKGPEGLLNSPWIKISEGVERTSVRREFSLRKGLNLLKMEIDANSAVKEYESVNNNGSMKLTPLEANNTTYFAIELVTTLEKPDIKLPRQKIN